MNADVHDQECVQVLVVEILDRDISCGNKIVRLWDEQGQLKRVN